MSKSRQKMGIRTRTALWKTFVYICLSLISICCILPLLWLIRSSFMDMIQIFELPPKWIPDPWVFTNFGDALVVLPFALYFFNTMLLVVINIIGVVGTSVLCAYGFSRFRWKGRDKVFFLLLTTMMVPGCITLIPTFLIWSNLGAVNTYIPLTVPAFFGGGVFNIFLLRQFFMGIPKGLDEAAKIDGAGSFRILTSILVPSLKPIIIVISLFTFFGVWNDFFGPLIYLNNDKMFTLALGLRSFIGQMRGEWQMLMAASLMCIAPPLALFALGQRYILEGITFTGMKG